MQNVYEEVPTKTLAPNDITDKHLKIKITK